MNTDKIEEKKVQLLLSTYNGQTYLREQLDSFLNLDGYHSIKVLIRDDGSTDGTLEILEEYQTRYGFEVIRGENVGVNASMQILFKSADMQCEYFALSDQDDVWLEDKITRALEVLENKNPNIPLLFASCSQVVDSQLIPIRSTLVPKKGVTLYNAMSQNVTPGHTQVFNKKLLEKLQNLEGVHIHVIDWWIYLVATALGEVYFSNQFTVLHRQHGNNAVGYETNILKTIPFRLKRIRQNKANSISKQLRDFRNLYGAMLPLEFKGEIEDYLESQKNILTRVSYIRRTKVYRQLYLETLVFKMLYLMGKYNL